MTRTMPVYSGLSIILVGMLFAAGCGGHFYNDENTLRYQAPDFYSYPKANYGRLFCGYKGCTKVRYRKIMYELPDKPDYFSDFYSYPYHNSYYKRRGTYYHE